jgi:hypothetical protein
MANKCSNDKCLDNPVWYSIIDGSLFCDKCAGLIGSYVRPVIE